MNLELFRKYRIRPSKRLGQNFLVERGVIKKIIEAAKIQPEDIVLEIGPGLGALTQGLAKKAKKVVAIEKDSNLARILNDELRIKNIKNVEVIQGDVLKIINSTTAPFQRAGLSSLYSKATAKFIIPNSYKVVANLPFYLAAPVIRKFLEIRNRPEEMILIVQKEVAQRICAKPPDMNLLAVSVQFYSKPEIISYVSRKSFWPSPKVDTAIIKITPQNKWSRTVLDQLFFEVVKAGFSQPRKQVINNLSHLSQDFGGQAKKINRKKISSWLLKNNIQPIQRAETLTIEDWISLTKSCKIE